MKNQKITDMCPD